MVRKADLGESIGMQFWAGGIKMLFRYPSVKVDPMVRMFVLPPPKFLR